MKIPARKECSVVNLYKLYREFRLISMTPLLRFPGSYVAPHSPRWSGEEWYY